MENQTEKIQEMQLIEQSLQNLIFQKQSFQIELTETQTALSEIENSGEDVYKIIGQLMLKSEKNKILEELKNKQKILEIRIKTMENQEKNLSEKLNSIQKQFLKEMNSQEKNKNK